MRSRWSVGFVFSMLCLVTALYSVKQVPDARVIYSADFSLSNHWYRFEIEKTGIYNLTYSDLSSLPLADMDPRNIRIFTNGGALLNINSSETGNPFLEIPLYIQGESDGTFHEEDRIIFYAENRDSPNKNSSVSQTNNPYSGTCSYWLNFDGDYGYPPRRMEFLQAVSGEAITTTEYLHSVHFEQENIRKTIDNFKWFSTKIHQGGNEAFSTDINIIDPVSSGAIQGIIELSLEQSGDTSGIVNTINVENNGVSAFLQNWSAIQGYYISKSDFPLYSAVNNIKLELLSSNPVFLDYINLKYQRRFIKHQNESYFIDIQQSDAGLNRCFRFETDSEEELLVFQADNYSEAYLVPFVRESNGLSFTTDCKQVNASYNIEPDYYIVSIENLLRVNQLSAYSPGELSEIQPETDCFIITPDDFLSQSQTLAHLYSEFKGINSLIIRLNDVFDTYNGGNPDPGAVRLYLKNSLRQLSKPESLQVILIGSGTNDWRGFDQKSIPLNKMIVYQRGFITSDDFFTMFIQTELPEVRIARIPVLSQEEFGLYLTRIEENYTTLHTGWWRNSVLLMADDENNNSTDDEYYFTEDIEEAVQLIGTNKLVKRIYATDYERDAFNNKPAVRDTLINTLNNGVMLWYYMGHGHADKLGEENFFNLASDVKRLANSNRLPLFIAASCNVGQFDSNDFDCLGRNLLFQSEGGVIASITASRICLGAESHIFAMKVMSELVNNEVSPMEAFYRAKTTSLYTYNSIKFNYFGDPYLNWRFPKLINPLVVTEDSKPIPSFWKRQMIQFQGDTGDSINIETAVILAFDNDASGTLPNSERYSYAGKVIYKGTSPVSDNSFSSGFTIPDDAKAGDKARIIAYLYDETSRKDYISSLNPIKIYNQTLYSNDTTSPKITILLDSPEFQSGDIVSCNPSLIIKIEDESGINITNSSGHPILMSLDNGVTVSNITDEFIYEESSSTVVVYSSTLTELKPGIHSLQLIAYDNINNLGIETVNFKVTTSEDLHLTDMFPYPNPMPKDGGYFTAVVNKPVDVSLKIFTLSGRKIRTLQGSGSHYLQIKWDGLDSNGDEIAKGNYFYNLTAKSLDGTESVKKLGKLIITD